MMAPSTATGVLNDLRESLSNNTLGFTVTRDQMEEKGQFLKGGEEAQ